MGYKLQHRPTHGIGFQPWSLDKRRVSPTLDIYQGNIQDLQINICQQTTSPPPMWSRAPSPPTPTPTTTNVLSAPQALHCVGYQASSNNPRLLIGGWWGIKKPTTTTTTSHGSIITHLVCSGVAYQNSCWFVVSMFCHLIIHWPLSAAKKRFLVQVCSGHKVRQIKLVTKKRKISGENVIMLATSSPRSNLFYCNGWLLLFSCFTWWCCSWWMVSPQVQGLEPIWVQFICKHKMQSQFNCNGLHFLQKAIESEKNHRCNIISCN